MFLKLALAAAGEEMGRRVEAGQREAVAVLQVKETGAQARVVVLKVFWMQNF